jgi:hypothetical protein
VSPRPISILLLTLIVALTVFVAAVVIWSLYNRTSAPGVPNTPMVQPHADAGTPSVHAASFNADAIKAAHTARE